VSYENLPVLFAYDIDNTVRPGDEYPPAKREQGWRGLEELGRALRTEKLRRSQAGQPRFYSGPATGRLMVSLEAQARQEPQLARIVLAESDLTITGVGTQLGWRSQPDAPLTPDADWPPPNPLWRPEKIRAYLNGQPHMATQEAEAQDFAKISYILHGLAETATGDYAAALTAELQHRGWPAQVIVSDQAGLTFCDVLPPGIDKGAPYAFARDCIAREHDGLAPLTIFGGDSMNDCGAARRADLVLLPLNAEPAFREWARDPKEMNGVLFEAQRNFAYGLLDGLVEHGVVRIPA